MSTLFLSSEETGDSWQVWPIAVSIPAGRVHEAASYIFELRNTPSADAADLLIDDVSLEGLRAPSANSARWRWLPGFNAGMVEAELRVPGHTARRIEITTDPDQRKLTRDDFDSMVRDILSDTTALFSLSGFRKSVARGIGRRPPAIARLEFLRSRVSELESVVASIARNPRQMVAAEELSLPYHRASRATPEEILRSFRIGRILHEVSVPGRLPTSLRGSLPERIRLRQRRSSLDIAEHRQMAACLRSWTAWLKQAGELIECAEPYDSHARGRLGPWAGRCRRLARRLLRMTLLPPFAEASDAKPTLTISALFRRDAAYRRFYRLWQDMNAGIASVFGDFLNLPLARTFELYELWCFLRLVRACIDEFGSAQTDIAHLFVEDARGGVTLVTRDVAVTVGSAWRISFQKRYREFWVESGRDGSYSRIMVPDVVFFRAGSDQAQLIVLDAKYRIHESLNDALSSIHTYRDALVREVSPGETRSMVSAAYLLSPHCPVVEEDYRAQSIPDRLFHADYRARFQFGAFTLRPGMASSDIAKTMRLIITGNTAVGTSR